MSFLKNGSFKASFYFFSINQLMIGINILSLIYLFKVLILIAFKAQNIPSLQSYNVKKYPIGKNVIKSKKKGPLKYFSAILINGSYFEMPSSSRSYLKKQRAMSIRNKNSLTKIKIHPSAFMEGKSVVI